ncbi:MAG: ABC transporter substrate-binding protein [Trueperaceae bacterium]
MTRLRQGMTRWLMALALLLLTAGAGMAQDRFDLTVVFGEEADTLDPHMTTLIVPETIQENMFDRLVRISSTGEVVPHVASSWEWVEPTRLRLVLREDVYFHDGTQLTADDVAYNFERVANPDVASPIASRIPQVSEVEVVDPFTVDLLFAETNAEALTALARLMIVPQHIVEEVGDEAFAQIPVGSGPFRFVEWQRGVHILLEANDDYWGGRPEVDRAIFKNVPEAATRVAELRTGRADIVANIPPESATDGPGYTIKTAPSTRRLFITMDSSRPPFDDVRVRQALNYAIDKEAIVEFILGGHATQTNGYLGPNWDVEYDNDRQPYPYDPERSRELLAEAGYENGAPFVFTYPVGRYPKDSEIGETVGAMLEEAGFQVELDPKDPSTYATMAFRELSLQVGLSQGTGFPTAEVTRNGYWNRGVSVRWFDDAQLLDMVEEARTIVDDEERLALLREIDEYVFEQAVFGFLFSYDDIWGVSNRIEWAPDPATRTYLMDVSIR